MKLENWMGLEGICGGVLGDKKGNVDQEQIIKGISKNIIY